MDKLLLPALKGQAGLAVQRYTAAYAYLAGYLLAFPALVAGIDAPHGKFTSAYSRLNVNGNVAWLVMELVSPITFYLSLTRSYAFTSLTLPTQILALAFLAHYTNRAVLSTLRQRTARSPMMFFVPILAASYNLANGHALGSWLAGFTAAPAFPLGAVPASGILSPLFIGGIALWAAGLFGNIYHDEILRRLRGPGKPAYSLPTGGLYDAPFGGISFPNYVCEWLEWTGFAIAATLSSPSCPPPLIGQGLRAVGWRQVLACPPWLFVFTELAFMSPRAMSGHRWYRKKFAETMPKQRRAMIPGVL